MKTQLDNFSRANFGGTFTFFPGSVHVFWGRNGRAAARSRNSLNPATEFPQWNGWFAQETASLSYPYAIYGRAWFPITCKTMNFAPRFGIAWYRTRKLRTSVRVAASLSPLTADNLDTKDSTANISYIHNHGSELLPNVPKCFPEQFSATDIRVKDDHLKRLTQ